METPIEIPELGDTREVARWIWCNLVPKSGQSSTIQGELLRAVEKLSREAQSNGNVNWDSSFAILVDFVESTLCGEPGITNGVKQSLRKDCDVLRNYEYPYTEEDLYDRLTEAVVAFCRLHPRLIPKPVNTSLHC